MGGKLQSKGKTYDFLKVSVSRDQTTKYESKKLGQVAIFILCTQELLVSAWTPLNEIDVSKRRILVGLQLKQKESVRWILLPMSIDDA